MDAVKRAAEAVMNSPLFRKKFCNEPKEKEEERQTLMGASAKESEIDPRKDLTPFVQGLYHSADFLGMLLALCFSADVSHILCVALFIQISCVMLIRLMNTIPDGQLNR